MIIRAIRMTTSGHKAIQVFSRTEGTGTAGQARQVYGGLSIALPVLPPYLDDRVSIRMTMDREIVMERLNVNARGSFYRTWIDGGHGSGNIFPGL